LQPNSPAKKASRVVERALSLSESFDIFVDYSKEDGAGETFATKHMLLVAYADSCYCYTEGKIEAVKSCWVKLCSMRDGRSTESLPHCLGHQK